MQRWLFRIFVNAVALWVAANLVPGIHLDGQLWSILFVAAVFGVVNAVIRPFVLLLSLPFLVLTLGIFTFVVNALMLLLTAWMVPALVVDGFGSALFGSLLVSLVSVLFWVVLPEDQG